jgi:hypothetical protein
MAISPGKLRAGGFWVFRPASWPRQTHATRIPLVHSCREDADDSYLISHIGDSFEKWPSCKTRMIHQSHIIPDQEPSQTGVGSRLRDQRRWQTGAGALIASDPQIVICLPASTNVTRCPYILGWACGSGGVLAVANDAPLTGGMNPTIVLGGGIGQPYIYSCSKAQRRGPRETPFLPFPHHDKTDTNPRRHRQPTR